MTSDVPAAAPTARPAGFDAVQYLRSRTFDVLWGLWSLCFLPVILVLMPLRRPTNAIRVLARFWMRVVLWMLEHIVGLKYREIGQENIPSDPCIIISNHQSPWEGMTFILRFPDVAYIAKKELVRIPIFGWYVKHFPMILVQRGGGAPAIRQMVEDCRAALAAGRPILIFPEGTRKRLATRVEFKRGIEHLYAGLNVPVLPIALNSGAFWGPDQPFRRRGTITVSYLPPIAPGLSPAEFKAHAEALLQSEKGRLLQNLGAGG
jgi:1-acyl-sn-glycerol-3-phosphate acyltransferase